MSRKQVFGLVLVLPMLLLGMVSPTVEGSEMSLDFSKEHTLKGIFDAGMRPYREPHSERFQVGVEQVTAEIKLPSGMLVKEREWQSMRFTVVDDGRLTSAQMRSNPLTLEAARDAMLPLLSIESGVSIQALDAFLEKVREEIFLYEGEFHVGTGKKQNPMFLAAFSRTGLKNSPLALRVSLEWRLDPPKAAKGFYKDPIPPPPGYEGVSMEKPPFQAEAQAPTPEVTAETQAKPRLVEEPQFAASPTPAMDTNKPASSGFPVVPVAILTAVIAGIVIYLLRRKST